MNILVIGNGFDLAHGLPTKYTDFLGFVERFENLKKSSMIMSSGGLSNTAKPIYEYMNIWINLFLKRPNYRSNLIS